MVTIQKLTEPQPSATATATEKNYIAVGLVPGNWLSPSDLPEIANDLLRAIRRFQRDSSDSHAYIELEEAGFADLFTGWYPRKVWARVVLMLNTVQKITKSGRRIVREPSGEQVAAYRAWFGNTLTDDAITFLIPLPAACPRIIPGPRYEAALRELRETISELEKDLFAKTTWEPVCLEPLDDRHRMFSRHDWRQAR